MYNYEILFKDSPEYFTVKNARLVIEERMVRFLKFDDKNNYIEDEFYPMMHLHRIKRRINEGL